jgi:hypothetical protein
MLTASNVNFIHNLVWNPDASPKIMFFWLGGGTDGNGNDPDLATISSRNIDISYNTFVNINDLIQDYFSPDVAYGFVSTPVPPNIHNNIFFGLATAAPNGAYTYLQVLNELINNTQVATLLGLYKSDYNGFIPAVANYEAVLTQTSNEYSYYTKAQAQSTFGLDVHSVVVQESDPANIFVDPANHDYHLKNPSLFPGMGYYGADSPVTTCTSFTYSAWSSCQSNSTQSRSVTSSLPSDCTGGTPDLTQSCTYTIPLTAILSISPTTYTVQAGHSLDIPITATLTGTGADTWISQMVFTLTNLTTGLAQFNLRVE